MRGLFLKHPLEFRLEVKGDSFFQGQDLSCALIIKNHGDAPALVAEPTVVLVRADLKKVKAKDASAFEIIQRAELERGIEVAPKSEVQFLYTVTLDRNVPITDKGQSPYLLYGNSESFSELGQLLVTVIPHQHLRAVFDTCTFEYAISFYC